MSESSYKVFSTNFIPMVGDPVILTTVVCYKDFHHKIKYKGSAFLFLFHKDNTNCLIQEEYVDMKELSSETINNLIKHTKIEINDYFFHDYLKTLCINDLDIYCRNDIGIDLKYPLIFEEVSLAIIIHYWMQHICRTSIGSILGKSHSQDLNVVIDSL